MIVTLIIYSSAVSATEPVATPAELGKSLRTAIGLGTQACALLGMSGEEYTALAEAVSTHIQANRATVEPLIEAVAAARKDLLRAYEVGAEVIETKEQALITATNALATGCQSLLTSVSNGMPAGRATAFARAAQNRLLDSRVALLDLTSEQRTALRSAQRDRDSVLLHHQKRKNHQAIKAAMEAYESAVTSILTEPQRTARAQMETECAAKLSAILVADAAALGE